MPSTYSRFRNNIHSQYNRFVDDAVVDFISSIDFVATKTGISPHYKWTENGECRECHRPGPQHWCIPYETRRFQRKFKKWTSESKELDEFIRQTQLSATSPNDYLEWIPYYRLHEVEEIGKGGSGVVYVADWVCGPKLQWRENSHRWARLGPTKVALKCLNNSKKITTEFLNEIKLHHRCIIGDHILRCYGITRSPEGNYMIVMQYANQGNLRNVLEKKFAELEWEDKLQILKDIIDGLRLIHNTSLLHKDIHSGNLLRHVDAAGNVFTYLADLGLCNRANKRASFIVEKPVFGVLPYVAPEVMRGGEYTKGADIYSFGIVMWELASGTLPFANRPHNYHLALDICKGLRPSLSCLMSIPKSYIELMERCWDAIPSNRPDVQELRSTLERLYAEPKENDFADAEKERIPIADNVIESSSQPPVLSKHHSQAVYTSRLLNFLNLPEPQNSASYEPTNYEFIEFEEGQVTDTSHLELFIPKTVNIKCTVETVITPAADLPKIPELKVDSSLLSLDDMSEVMPKDGEKYKS